MESQPERLCHKDSEARSGAPRFSSLSQPMERPPKKLDLKKDRGLTIEWADGSTSYYSIPYLRKFSPSADARQLRDEMARNPLTVLPANFGGGGTGPGGSGALAALSAELVGNYALRITFSDGHNTGIYSWEYLREIDPALAEARRAASDGGVTGAPTPDADAPKPTAVPRTRIG